MRKAPAESARRQDTNVDFYSPLYQIVGPVSRRRPTLPAAPTPPSYLSRGGGASRRPFAATSHFRMSEIEPLGDGASRMPRIDIGLEKDLRRFPASGFHCRAHVDAHDDGVGREGMPPACMARLVGDRGPRANRANALIDGKAARQSKDSARVALRLERDEPSHDLVELKGKAA